MIQIKIEAFKRVFNISIGYKSKWAWQIYFITVIEEFYKNKELTPYNANMLLKFWKRGKQWQE